MAPEYGATCGVFPVDAESLRYLIFSGRPKWRVDLAEAYLKEQGLFHTASSPEPVFSDALALDLATVEPSVAGPKRPQDRVSLRRAKQAWLDALPALMPATANTLTPRDANGSLRHGSVVIAAITSCTNTSNPSVMVAAGLLAKKAVECGLVTKPWVKTSLAPGSKVVTDYLEQAGLMRYLEQLRFHLVGYGCTTCIGNSGPLPEEVSKAIREDALVVVSVLSGNRNFEGRVQAEVRANYLMSPPLVVAYALAGRMDIDLYGEPLGTAQDGTPVFLKDIWPTTREVAETVERAVRPEMFAKQYGAVFDGDARWNALPVPEGDLYAWDPESTYIKRAPYFDDMAMAPAPAGDIAGARVLLLLGDSITTDHISPAGSIKKDSPAGKYLIGRGVEPKDFNQYGTRRGNDEVMVRGTFANVRIRNKLAPGTEGGVTKYLPTGEVLSVYDASVKYQAERTPLLVIAGKEYGSGSSRDWAAKGPRLLGIRAVLAETYERIHRSNLVGMGLLPLQFAPGQTAGTLALTGEETFDIQGVKQIVAGSKEVTVRARRADGSVTEFRAVVRIDTPKEVEYYRHGGILEYVLRQLAGAR